MLRPADALPQASIKAKSEGCRRVGRARGAGRASLAAGFSVDQVDRATTTERMPEQKCERVPSVGTACF